MAAKKAKPRVTDGAGNVFADMCLPKPEQEMVKARVTLQIYQLIRQRGLTQVSVSMRNRSGNFPVGRLIEFLTALGQDVQITVKPTRKEHGAVSVSV